ncbi:cupin domain-containing protein [Phenylobacterium sp.]|jgi:quercetin dioxygenase-like cupin family protein|uniref:cupin domain-containing protein n=1 Tax=Phenylobacterium sp. TaxID=1871053 RepID=UPI002F92EF8F
MTATALVPATGGVAFEDGSDHGRVIVSGRETGGRYALMEYVVAAGGPEHQSAPSPAYGAHGHREIEETFLVQQGELQFLLEDQVLTLGPGDFVRVPPGARHGFANLTAEPVRLLVSFHPGGFEELFLRHRTDQHPPPRPLGFIEDAVAEFASEFEDHPLMTCGSA